MYKRGDWMAKITRCVICDEKLVRNRCPLCGYDHTRLMNVNYRLNTTRPQNIHNSTISQKAKQTVAPNVPTAYSTQKSTAHSARRTTQTVPNRRRVSTDSATPKTDWKKELESAAYKRAQTVYETKKDAGKNGKAQTIIAGITILLMLIGMLGNLAGC